MKNFLSLVFTFVLLGVSYSQTYNWLCYHPMLDTGLAPFYYGVAAGDSRSDGFVIWTRVVLKDTSKKKIKLNWFVSTSPKPVDIVQKGTVYALAKNDFTAKVVIHNLHPWTEYYYWFSYCDSVRCKTSSIGRVKTTPADSQMVRSLNFAVFTGSNYNAGFFNAYCDVARRKNIDFAVHTGDYIYEYGSNHYGANQRRWLMPEYEVVSRRDYELRYSHYRLDSCLRKAHEAMGWYTVWDDHEVANDSWKYGAANHQPRTEGAYLVRKSNAVKAYFEWLPIRDNPDSSVIRAVSMGKLSYVIFLDTRHCSRSYQHQRFWDSSKTMLGGEQLLWLFTQLLYAKAKGYRWIIVVQQLPFGPFLLNGKVINTDGWDSYPIERQKIMRFLYNNDIKNVVFVGGDIHSSWVNELYLTPETYFGRHRDTMVAIEFITPSITSPSAGWLATLIAKVGSKTPIYNYIRYVNIHRKGYMVLRVRPDEVEADYFYVRTIKKPDARSAVLAKRYIYKGLRKNE